MALTLRSIRRSRSISPPDFHGKVVACRRSLVLAVERSTSATLAQEVEQQSVHPLRLLVLNPVGRLLENFQPSAVALFEARVCNSLVEKPVLSSPDHEDRDVDAGIRRWRRGLPHRGPVP